MTDVLRSALSNNRSITLTTNRGSAEYVVTGTVTRYSFGRLDNPRSASGLFDSVNMAGRSGNSREIEVNPGVAISAQIVHIRTGDIISSRTIQAATWEEYQRKAAGMATALIERVPPPAAAPAVARPPSAAPAAPPPDLITGTWEVTLDHGNFSDTYRLTFSGGNRCSVTVTSVDRSGARKTQTGSGNYTYQSDILNLTVRFDNNTISHLSRIEWRVRLALSKTRSFFNAFVPVSKNQGAARVRGKSNRKKDKN